MDHLPPELCQQLRAARRARGWTQAQLAQRVGCQQSAVSMMEAGRTTALARETLVQIAAELGVVLAHTAATPASDVAAPASGVAHCTDPQCPSNVPFVVSGALVFWPRPQPVAGGRHCAYCGEVLAGSCGTCGVPASAGACCTACGAQFVPAPATVLADIDAWAEARRRQIAEWRSLL